MVKEDTHRPLRLPDHSLLKYAGQSDAGAVPFPSLPHPCIDRIAHRCPHKSPHAWSTCMEVAGMHESPSQSAHNRLYIYCIKVYSFRPATPARAARQSACMRLSPSRRRHSPWRGRTWWCHCTSQWAVRMQNLHWDTTQRPGNQRRGGMKERKETARGCASRGSRGLWCDDMRGGQLLRS